MKTTINCCYCGSIDVPEDLVCISTCELCCSQSVDILFDSLGFIRRALLKRHMRRWRFMMSDFDA